MIFHETELSGCYLIESEPIEDKRGFFARTFDADEFRQHGLNWAVAQTSVSYNHVAGTLRGLHYQTEPYEEAKLISCTRGHVFDVVTDLRSMSRTFMQWQSFELSERDHSALYVPEGVAHGFMTLTDESVLLYQISTPYNPDAARGLRWNDPALRIAWPRTPTCVSSRDAAWPLTADVRRG